MYNTSAFHKYVFFYSASSSQWIFPQCNFFWGGDANITYAFAVYFLYHCWWMIYWTVMTLFNHHIPVLSQSVTKFLPEISKYKCGYNMCKVNVPHVFTPVFSTVMGFLVLTCVLIRIVISKSKKRQNGVWNMWLLWSEVTWGLDT
jgi:hypothetical protein